ncbi:FGGY family carbohydrate kinase [Paractinoplanes rishiriensis]|nr:FGGY family carbohydrate kinase [Actinoplanes rishiriensis]
MSSIDLVLAIDQGTTNTKAALVDAAGRIRALGSAPVGVSTPRPGWVEQDAGRIWRSVLEAAAACLAGLPATGRLAGVALSTQRESVVAWRAGTGEPVGPVIGWQDRRTAAWCAEAIDDAGRAAVLKRTGLRVDAMFSAPKMRWVLDHLPAGDVRVGTVDAWLIRQLTAGGEHLCEAGNASRTLLYDVTTLAWSPELLALFGIPAQALPQPLASDAGFGRCRGAAPIPDGVPIVAVLADSHAALYGHGCVRPGMAKATYGTGTSVMTPVPGLPPSTAPVPTTLAWLIGGVPAYALEGNILSSGATLTWTAGLLTGGDVGALVRLAETVPDSGGVTLVPAFAGLGAPHWDRSAQAVFAGMTTGTGPAHVARAAVDAVAHQVCDIVEAIGPLRTFRADGGATSAALVMQCQADLLGRQVDVSAVAEVSALGVAKLAWQALGHPATWTAGADVVYTGTLGDIDRAERRARWAGEVARARFTPAFTPAFAPPER